MDNIYLSSLPLNNNAVYVAQFYYKKDNRFYLNSCSSSYLELYNLSLNNIGDCIIDLFPEIYCINITKIFNITYSKNTPLTTVRNSDYFEAVIRNNEKSSIYIFGMKRGGDTMSLLNKIIKENINLDLVFDKAESSLVIKKENDFSFLVKSFSPLPNSKIRFNLTIDKDLYASDINSILHKDRSILNYCINKQKTVHLLDVVTCEDTPIKTLITIVPTATNKDKYITLLFSQMDKETFFSIQEKLLSFGQEKHIMFNVDKKMLFAFDFFQKTFLHMLNSMGINQKNKFDFSNARFSSKAKNDILDFKNLHFNFHDGKSNLIMDMIIMPLNNDEVTMFLRISKHFVGNDNLIDTLTQRELEIIKMIKNGLSNKEIAQTLYISEGTVKKTIHNAYKKLFISNRFELLKFFYENNN